MTHRSLYTIGEEIIRDWQSQSKKFPAAIPYVYAMRECNQITDMYGSDTALSVVLYFLSNASTWRGDTAKRIKAELKAIVKSTGYKM